MKSGSNLEKVMQAFCFTRELGPPPPRPMRRSPKKAVHLKTLIRQHHRTRRRWCACERGAGRQGVGGVANGPHCLTLSR